jgi:hypothetical protein
MLRYFAIVGLIMFSLSTLSASADTWEDRFESAELDERWEAAISYDEAPKPPADWKVDNGVLKGHWSYQGQQMLLMKQASRAYTIQVKCRIDEALSKETSPWVGIAFHSSKGPYPFQFCAFAVDHGGRAFWKRVGSDWSDWAESLIQADYKPGEWFTLELKLSVQQEFLVYLNDQCVLMGYDPLFSGSFVGLAAGECANVSFDDFTVTDQVSGFERLAALSTARKKEYDTALVPASVKPGGKLSVTWGRMKAEH